MSREDVIEIKATVMESLSAALFKVEIENGHRFLGFLARDLRAASTRLSPGDTIMVRMSPFDLSKGRIVGVVKSKSDL